MDIKLFYEALHSSTDKVGYLMELRDDPATSTWDVRWDNLIADWSNNDWPMKRAKKFAN